MEARCASRLIVLVILALAIIWPRGAHAAVLAVSSSSDDQVCDAIADYYLGMEDYPEAIRRHRIVIHKDPDNALAHYHLGFAYGILGDHREELTEYQNAISLGLDDWQLFLNLGLLYLENGQLSDATRVLQLATLLGPTHAETHFNLALAYERRAMPEQAEQQILLSLQIDPNQPEAHNTLGAIYAEEGQYGRAGQEWNELVAANPDYEPARANLNILGRVERGELKGTTLSGFTAEP